MPDLISFSDPLMLMGTEQGLRDLMQTNLQTSEHGLLLTAQDAREIIEYRNEVLQSCARVEFSYAPLVQIIETLSASPFVSRADFAQTVQAFVELFYDAKNETLDTIGDEELIEKMTDYFNNSCMGSLELLESRELFNLMQAARNGSVFTAFDEEGEEDEENEEEEF